MITGPEFSEQNIPTLAVRIAQGLVLFALLMMFGLMFFVLILLMFGGLGPRNPDVPEVTSVAIGFAVGILIVKFLLLRPLFGGLAWMLSSRRIQHWRHRFRHGLHYCLGVTGHGMCYLFASEFLWIAFLIEQNPLAAICGLVISVLMLVEFPTQSRAKAWTACYFQPVPSPTPL